MLQPHVDFVEGSFWEGLKEAVPMVRSGVLLENEEGMKSSLIMAVSDWPHGKIKIFVCTIKFGRKTEES